MGENNVEIKSYYFIIFRSSDSPALKPVKVDNCLSNKEVEVSHNNEVELSHDNELSTEVSLNQIKNTLYCLGCDKQFEIVSLFNKHAFFVHCEDADSMFFKNHKGTFFNFSRNLYSHNFVACSSKLGYAELAMSFT